MSCLLSGLMIPSLSIARSFLEPAPDHRFAAISLVRTAHSLCSSVGARQSSAGAPVIQ
jgi:hypothetical protein